MADALGTGGAAAGTYYLPVLLINVSRHTCWLSGRPRITLYDAGGTQVGRTVRVGMRLSRPLARRRDLIAPEGIEHVTIAVGNPSFYDTSGDPASSTCHPMVVARMTTHLPGRTHDLDPLLWHSTVCTTENGRPLVTPIELGASG